MLISIVSGLVGAIWSRPRSGHTAGKVMRRQSLCGYERLEVLVTGQPHLLNGLVHCDTGAVAPRVVGIAA